MAEDKIGQTFVAFGTEWFADSTADKYFTIICNNKQKQ